MNRKYNGFMTGYNSKRGTVNFPPYQLYMVFADLRNFLNYLPEDKRQSVSADYDTISVKIQNFDVGVKVHERVPYSRITLVDNGAPFAFKVDFCFDSNNGAVNSTIFHIDVEADLNFMMKMLLGSKIQTALDKIVDTIVDASNGKMPEGFDPSNFNAADFFHKS